MPIDPEARGGADPNTVPEVMNSRSRKEATQATDKGVNFLKPAVLKDTRLDCTVAQRLSPLPIPRVVSPLAIIDLAVGPPQLAIAFALMIPPITNIFFQPVLRPIDESPMAMKLVVAPLAIVA